MTAQTERVWNGNTSAASGGTPVHVVEAIQHQACTDL
jgi:hypothetical protein